MAREVETFAFLFFRRTQTHDLVDDEEEDGRTDTRPEQGEHNGLDLHDDLRGHIIGASHRREDGIVEEALTTERRIRLTTPVAMAPTMPPMQWTPKTSSVSS